jgi:hypothetical protein
MIWLRDDAVGGRSFPGSWRARQLSCCDTRSIKNGMRRLAANFGPEIGLCLAREIDQIKARLDAANVP